MKRNAERLVVIGNWKMNPTSVGAAKKLLIDVRKSVGKLKNDVVVAVMPPQPYIGELARLLPGGRILLGAQDYFHEERGAYTGEVSLPMLKSLGVSLVLVGHSERRARGEREEDIAANVRVSTSRNMITVLCVGEHKRDSHGSHFTVVESQLKTALAGVVKTKLKYLMIAYEPVWAIGTGNNATGEDIEEMRLFITKVLTDLYGRVPASAVRILYGGSVNEKNAAGILAASAVDGFLIGGASLKVKSFSEVVKQTARHGIA